MKRLINIYGRNKDAAIDHMHSLSANYQYEITIHTQDRFETKREKFRAFGLSESNRGAKFHDALVDKNITLGEYENYIRYQQLKPFEEDAGFIRLY